MLASWIARHAEFATHMVRNPIVELGKILVWSCVVNYLSVSHRTNSDVAF
jgi:hypothetical protein